MKLLRTILWLGFALSYGLAPFWAIVFGIIAIGLFIQFSLTALLTGNSPSAVPLIVSTILFLVCLVASHAQYGSVKSETTTNAPPPHSKGGQ